MKKIIEKVLFAVVIAVALVAGSMAFFGFITLSGDFLWSPIMRTLYAVEIVWAGCFAASLE